MMLLLATTFFLQHQLVPEDNCFQHPILIPYSRINHHTLYITKQPGDRKRKQDRQKCDLFTALIVGFDCEIDILNNTILTKPVNLICFDL